MVVCSKGQCRGRQKGGANQWVSGGDLVLVAKGTDVIAGSFQTEREAEGFGGKDPIPPLLAGQTKRSDWRGWQVTVHGAKEPDVTG